VSFEIDPKGSLKIVTADWTIHVQYLSCGRSPDRATRLAQAARRADVVHQVGMDKMAGPFSCKSVPAWPERAVSPASDKERFCLRLRQR